jgi:hypothetical protein
MCFFDQHIYQCGDFKWGNFRQQCTKECRTGEVCSIKLVLKNVQLDQECKICKTLNTKHRRKAKEEENIARWKREQSYIRRTASIEASEKIIDELDQAIAKLMEERSYRQKKLN